MRVETFVTDALGDASHVLLDGQSAAVIDPQRDVRPYVEAANRVGATIEYVFETHVHNDYLSGGRELAALGARVVAPASGRLEFPHIGIGDGDEVHVGGIAVKALAAPGHTYEHTAYLAASDGPPTAAFTGGSLLMGSAGRSDLLGPDDTETLTRAQWDSIHRLAATLDPGSLVYPTHGAGSFCSSSGSITDRSGPLKTEQGRNPALTLASYDLFRTLQLQPAPIPGYYRYMAPINREGPKVFGTPPMVEQLSAATAIERQEAGATVIDVRPADWYATGYLSGSLNIEQSSSFLAYVGWLVPFNASIVLVSSNTEQARIATIDLFRIGYERVEGVLLAADIPSGRRATFRPATVEEAGKALTSGERPVLDVRFAYEQAEAPLAGAIRAPIEQLAAGDQPLPSTAIVVCEAGNRASIAASYLRARGLDVVPVLGAGVNEVAQKLVGGA